MAQPPVDSGTGATLVFSTSSWTAEITDIKHSGKKRPSLKTSHLGLTAGAGELFQPGKLFDPGEIDIEFHFNPDSPPPYTATAENVSIKFPIVGTITTGSKDQINAFVIDFGETIPLENIMMGTAKLKCSGTISHTNAG